MSANAQSHRVTPDSGYSHWGNRPAASVAKQTDKQAAKLYSLDMDCSALTNNELYVGQW